MFVKRFIILFQSFGRQRTRSHTVDSGSILSDQSSANVKITWPVISIGDCVVITASWVPEQTYCSSNCRYGYKNRHITVIADIHISELSWVLHSGWLNWIESLWHHIVWLANDACKTPCWYLYIQLSYCPLFVYKTGNLFLLSWFCYFVLNLTNWHIYYKIYIIDKGGKNIMLSHLQNLL